MKHSVSNCSFLQVFSQNSVNFPTSECVTSRCATCSSTLPVGTTGSRAILCSVTTFPSPVRIDITVGHPVETDTRRRTKSTTIFKTLSSSHRGIGIGCLAKHLHRCSSETLCYGLTSAAAAAAAAAAAVAAAAAEPAAEAITAAASQLRQQQLMLSTKRMQFYTCSIKLFSSAQVNICSNFFFNPVNHAAMIGEQPISPYGANMTGLYRQNLIFFMTSKENISFVKQRIGNSEYRIFNMWSIGPSQ